MHNSSTRFNPRKMAFIRWMAFSKLRLKIHGKKFSTCNNVFSFNSKDLMVNLQPSSTLVNRESTHPPSRAICNLIFPASSSHCARQMVIRAFISVSLPSLRPLALPDFYSRGNWGVMMHFFFMILYLNRQWHHELRLVIIR